MRDPVREMGGKWAMSRRHRRFYPAVTVHYLNGGNRREAILGEEVDCPERMKCLPVSSANSDNVCLRRSDRTVFASTGGGHLVGPPWLRGKEPPESAVREKMVELLRQNA